jgi:hypothetical protein
MSAGPQGQQGQQGPKGPRGVVGATGWGYGTTTGPTGMMGFPSFSNITTGIQVPLTLATIGTIFQVVDGSTILSNASIQNADTGAFWTVYNPTSTRINLLLSGGAQWSYTNYATLNPTMDPLNYSYTLLPSNCLTVVASGNSNVFIPM